MQFSKHLSRLDWPLFIAALALSGAGLAVLYSLSVVSGDFLQFEKQLLFVVVGALAVLLLSAFDFRIFKNRSGAVLLVYGISVVLLAALFIFGVKVRGTAAWLQVGSFGFQSVEVTKLAIVILLAKYFSARHKESYRFLHIIISGMYVALPAVFVLLQPDFGSALTLALLWFGIVAFSGIKIKHLIILFLIAVIVSASAWFFFFKPYQKERILSFFDPTSDPSGASYNIIQSLAAVATGSWFGKGYLQGTQGSLGFLPEAKTDFIFSAFVEEFGFAGAAVLFIVFLFFLWRILRVGQQASNNFARIFCSGFFILILVHIVINISMNLNMLPVVGIPLPLVSYGGSHLITIFLGVAIVQSIRVHTLHKSIGAHDFIAYG
jgi:rod shape determining protein RodA